MNLACLGALRGRGALAQLQDGSVPEEHLGAAGDRLGVRVQCVQRRLGTQARQRDNCTSEGEREALTRPLSRAPVVSLAQLSTPGRSSRLHAAEDGPLGPTQGHERGGAASSSQAARPRWRQRWACSRRSVGRQPPPRCPAAQRGGQQVRVLGPHLEAINSRCARLSSSTSFLAAAYAQPVSGDLRAPACAATCLTLCRLHGRQFPENVKDRAVDSQRAGAGRRRGSVQHGAAWRWKFRSPTTAQRVAREEERVALQTRGRASRGRVGSSVEGTPAAQVKGRTQPAAAPLRAIFCQSDDVSEPAPHASPACVTSPGQAPPACLRRHSG